MCSNEWIPSFIIAIGQIAVAIGAFFSGPVCDNYGRRKTMVCGFIGVLIFGYALPFMPNWWSFTIAWAGVHFPLFFTNTATAVFVVEIIGPSQRSLATLRQTTMSIAGPLISLVAYFLPDWTHLSFFIATLAYALFLLIIFIPESPRWVNTLYVQILFTMQVYRLISMVILQQHCIL